MIPPPPLFSLRDVTFGFPGASSILRSVDFDLHPGERVALTGANGCGKTTLLHLMVGLRRPRAGRIHAFGRERRAERDFREVRARAQILFQDSDDQLFCPTVIEDVAFGPRNLGLSAREARRAAEGALEALGLAGFGERVTHKLSGGEKRMVALAAVLAMKPEALLLDEPTNGLDAASRDRVIAVLRGLEAAMVIVTHDRGGVARLAGRAVELCGGRLVALGARPRRRAAAEPA